MPPAERGTSPATIAKNTLGCVFVAWIVFMAGAAAALFWGSASGSLGWWFLSLLALGFGGLAGIVIFPVGLLASGSALKDRRLRREAEAISSGQESNETTDD